MANDIGFGKGDGEDHGEKVMIWLKTGGVLAFEAQSVDVTQRGGTLIDVTITPKDDGKGKVEYIDPSVVAAVVTEKQ